MKPFDLNIDRILENWQVSHAIRELIANALDEAVLTKTSTPTVTKDNAGWWRIRDYGRGLRIQDLVQSENQEKLANRFVIGKFGIGLKDALATFDRNDTKILIRSRHGDIGLSRVTKHLFHELVTLHATVSPPAFPELVGTECCLKGVSDGDILAAKQMFLQFSDNPPIEETKYGAVHQRTSGGSFIYMNGLRVAEEPNFLFSYNITSLDATIKRSLNRERQNLGRATYSDRVKKILLACESEQIVQSLTADLQAHSLGAAHDELAWLDVQEHAVRILNAKKRVLFLNTQELAARPDLVETAQANGYQIVAIPLQLSTKITDLTDQSGNPVNGLSAFVRQINDTFQFRWVGPESLASAERDVWSYTDRIFGLIGGLPQVVREIRISETMCSDPYSTRETCGLWDPTNAWIIIKRSELRSLPAFAGTPLHEALHAKYGVSDVSRAFETSLTELAGQLASRVLSTRMQT